MAKVKRKRNKAHKGSVMGRSDIPYAQRIQIQHRTDVAFNREQAAKVTMFCMCIAMHEIKGVGYKRLVRYSNRYIDNEREFYEDIEVGMNHAKTRMAQIGMPISGEFFADKVDGLTKREQNIHDNSLQAIQVALIVGAITMNDEFGYGQVVQIRISERVKELTERYKSEGVKFLLDEMEKIGFEIVNGTVRAYMDDDGNGVTPKQAKKAWKNEGSKGDASYGNPEN